MSRINRDPSRIPEEVWATAHAKARILLPLLRSGSQLTSAAIADVARQLGVSPQWTRTLLRRLREDPRASSLVPHTRGRPPGTTFLPEPVENAISHAISHHYLNRQRISLNAFVGLVQNACEAAGLPRPASSTIKRRVNALDPMRVLAAREGRRAAREAFGPSKHHFHASRPLECVQIDHTLVDAIVVDEMYREPIGRPWITLAIDVYTRIVLGYFLTLEAPSSLSVAMCVSHMVSDKRKWLLRHGIAAEWPSGIPNLLHMDNGPEFHSAALKRGCEENLIEIKHRPVRQPENGGHIERLIGTMMGKARLLPGATFSNPIDRGVYDSERQAVMTLSELDVWLAREIAEVYHRDIHSGISRAPLSFWQEAIAAGSPMRPLPDSERIRVTFLPAEYRTPRRDGIELFTLGYWNDAIPRLVANGVKRVLIHYDPRALSGVWLRVPGSDEFLELRYKDLRRPCVTLWEWRAARKGLLAQGRRDLDPAARFRAVEAQRRLLASAAEKTKAARRLVQRRAYAQRDQIQNLETGNDADLVALLDAGPPTLLDVEDWS